MPTGTDDARRKGSAWESASASSASEFLRDELALAT
jgi:hypothetical protein